MTGGPKNLASSWRKKETRMSRRRGGVHRLLKILAEEGVSGLVAVLVLGIAEHLHEKNWVSKPEESCILPGATLLEGQLKSAGIQPGDTILVHSSWDRLRFAFDSPSEVIRTFLTFLGPEGTLAMPAIPKLPSDDLPTIDFDFVISKAGLVSEVFRRFPGVTRSVSNNHSVCAVGPNASFLTDSHHLSVTTWDKWSPYRRMASLPNAWFVGFGVGRGLRSATALHCVESELLDHPYFSRLFKRTTTYSYKSSLYGDGTVTQLVRWGANYGPKLARFFSSDILFERTQCGIDFYAVRATTLVEQSVSLGLRGKTMYVWPVPWRWLFRKEREA